ncbi:MAG: spore protease YyaC [Sarcina sp.]
METKLYIDALDKNSSFIIKDYLFENLKPQMLKKKNLVFLCIGTDRSTGDSLGPIIGDKLSKLTRKNIYVFGTLENPVHAENLIDTIEFIERSIKNPYIIAIDACLGSINNVGKVLIQKTALSPGMAFNKELPKVGNLSILGIVNISSTLDFMVLQNTRLYTVMKLANSIYYGIHLFVIQSLGYKKEQILDFKLENIMD